MRGTPFDFEERRKSQQRDSDLDMLVRGKFERVGEIERQLTFFLATHDKKKYDRPGVRVYEQLCERFLATQTPQQVDDVKRAMRQMALMRVWLGQGAGVEDVAKDLIKKAMIKSVSRADWAVLLLEGWPGAGRRVSEDLIWGQSLRQPDAVAQQAPWHHALARLIELRLNREDYPNGLDVQSRTLRAVEQLWTAGGQAWEANDTQFQVIETLWSQWNASFDDDKVAPFIAAQRRHQLNTHAQVQDARSAVRKGSKL